MKTWGSKEFWGCGSEYDPDWVLTDSQKELRDKLIELCRTTIRPKAAECDRDYKYPRESLDSLASLGLLGLVVPKELGGLGENHVCCAMVVETIARYGCPSTAMVYTMHLVGCSMLLINSKEKPHVQQLLRRINHDKLIGTSVHSDPATGGHNWFPLSSKSAMVDDNTVKLLKHGAWATSAGHADWYAVQTVSPRFGGDYNNLSSFVVYKNDVRASCSDWSALGLHGNMSGPVTVDCCVDVGQLLGAFGDGQMIGDEASSPFFYLCAAACWNGVALASLDLGRKHVTRKAHADVGMRVSDYPVIQDYFGACMSSTSGCRGLLLLTCQALDGATSNCDWNTGPARGAFHHWLWQAKLNASENVIKVNEVMLKACGGTGYKSALGIERLLRDGLAGCVMAASSEVIRGHLGHAVLAGKDCSDLWQGSCNERVLHSELGKMSLHSKRELVEQLRKEVELEENNKQLKNEYQDTDFENPFNTQPPSFNDQIFSTQDGVQHGPALRPNQWTGLELVCRTDLSDDMSSFVFALPLASDHTGLLPGQYLAARVTIDGRAHERFFSPVSRPDDFGRLELVLRFESHGVISNFFRNLQTGAKVDFKGPCGGFEYEPNTLSEITLLASGGGITPGMQIIRSALQAKGDLTRLKLIYYCDSEVDILYKGELDSYVGSSDRLSVAFTLGEVPENWKGEEGFIDVELIEKYICKPSTQNHKIVVCGGPTMALTCLFALKTLGHPSQQVFVYGQFGTELIRRVYGRNVKLSSHRSDDNM